MTTSKPVLEVTNLSARYGKVGALAGATLTVPAGSIVTVIGANGAGKSTMLNAMMGALQMCIRDSPTRKPPVGPKNAPRPPRPPGSTGKIGRAHV